MESLLRKPTTMLNREPFYPGETKAMTTPSVTDFGECSQGARRPDVNSAVASPDTFIKVTLTSTYVAALNPPAFPKSTYASSSQKRATAFKSHFFLFCTSEAVPERFIVQNTIKVDRRRRD